MRDVIFHIADSHMEAGLQSFFSRDNWHHVLDCRPVNIEDRDLLRVGGYTDGGLWKHAHTNLVPFRARYRHAVIILDADFEPHPGANVIRNDIETNMVAAGWARDSFCVVVIEPELEAWLWAPNLNVAQAFGHSDFDSMRVALARENLWDPDQLKPNDLKRARDRAVRLGTTRRRTGGPIFRQVFSGISRRACDLCVEPGFITMRSALQSWFPREGVTV